MMIFLNWYFSYFTNWTLTLYFIDLYFGLPSICKYSLLLLLNTIAIGGLYITYISPKMIYVPVFNVLIKGSYLMILDFIFHMVPCIEYNIRYRQEKRNKSLYILLISLYYFIMNPYEKYGLTLVDLYIIIVHVFIMTNFCDIIKLLL